MSGGEQSKHSSRNGNDISISNTASQKRSGCCLCTAKLDQGRTGEAQSPSSEPLHKTRPLWLRPSVAAAFMPDLEALLALGYQFARARRQSERWSQTPSNLHRPTAAGRWEASAKIFLFFDLLCLSALRVREFSALGCLCGLETSRMRSPSGRLECLSTMARWGSFEPRDLSAASNDALWKGRKNKANSRSTLSFLFLLSSQNVYVWRCRQSDSNSVGQSASIMLARSCGCLCGLSLEPSGSLECGLGCMQAGTRLTGVPHRAAAR